MASTLLQIAQLGQPVLRKNARQVTDILQPNTQILIDNLIATVTDVNGVGIAAPQVYESKRIIVIASHPNPRYPHAPVMKPTAMINPVITEYAPELDEDWEGCLSIPGIRGLVPRAKHIRITYSDRNNKHIVAEYSDFVARIIQHEVDHLNGIVFLDRLHSVKDIITDKEFMKLLGQSAAARRRRK